MAKTTSSNRVYHKWYLNNSANIRVKNIEAVIYGPNITQGKIIGRQCLNLKPTGDKILD